MKRSVVAGLTGIAVALVAGCGSPTPPLALQPPMPASPSAAPTPQLLGEETKSAAEVYADMHRAFLAASSVHVSGTQLDGEELTRIEGQLTPTGGHFEERTASGTVSIITNGDVTYLKAPADYFGDDDEFPDQLADKWVALPGAEPEARINLATFFDELKLPPVGALRPTVRQEQVNGRPAVVLTYDNGETLRIANEGSPLLLSHTYAEETQTFDGYGAPVTITPPQQSVQLGEDGKPA